jgi:hypothetical protein
MRQIRINYIKNEIKYEILISSFLYNIIVENIFKK